MIDVVIDVFPYAALAAVPVLLAFAGGVAVMLIRDELAIWRDEHPVPTPTTPPVPVPIVTESVRVIDPQRAARLASATAVVLVAVTLVP